MIGVDVGLRPDMTVVEFEGNMAPGWIAKSPAGDDRCVDEPGTNGEFLAEHLRNWPGLPLTAAWRAQAARGCTAATNS